MLSLQDHVAKSSICSLVTSTSTAQQRVKYKQWTEMHIEKAFNAVQEGMSLRRAALEFGVPKTTLLDRLTGKVQFGAIGGGKRYLSNQEEKELVSFLLRCGSIGYPRSVKQIIAIVQNVVNQKKINAVVTLGWWQSFSSMPRNRNVFGCHVVIIDFC